MSPTMFGPVCKSRFKDGLLQIMAVILSLGGGELWGDIFFQEKFEGLKHGATSFVCPTEGS